MRLGALRLVFATLLVTSACSAKLLEEAPPQGGGPTGPGASSEGGASSDAASGAREPVPPTAPPPEGDECQQDQDCNDDRSVSAAWGRCYAARSGFKPPNQIRRACLCNPGAWMQRSGKCAPVPPPSCADQGGRCGDWGACASTGLRAGARTDSTCGGTLDAVCCIPSTICRPTEALNDSCYRKGTDEAYRPTCTNGWTTCEPGDSPEIEWGR